MNAYFFTNFSKRENSTKQPALNTGTELAVKLKNGCSAENPILLIKNFNFNYNYVYIFNSYYFITDITLINNDVTEVTCTIDVLATAKADIGNYYARVDRSASNYNAYAVDSAVMPTDLIVQTITETASITGWSQSGCYILNTIAITGGNRFFILTAAQLSQVLEFMFSGDVLDIVGDEAVKFFFDPMQYITSVTWFPIDASSFPVSGSSAVPVYLGLWNTGINAWQPAGLYNPTYTITATANYYNDFRDYNSAWTQLILFLPGYGSYILDPIYIDETITAQYTVSSRTGECKILLKVNGNIIADLSCQLGVPLQLTGTQQDIKGMIQGGLSMAGSVISGNYIAAAQQAVTMPSVWTPPTFTKGSLASPGLLLQEQSMKATIIRKGSTDYATGELGRPLGETRKLSTLSGFIRCTNASVPTTLLKNEKDLLNSYLNNGFYYE